MTLPQDDADLSPQVLREYAIQCLRQAGTFSYLPYTPAAPVAQPGFTAPQPLPTPDARPSGILYALQGLLAMQIANSITHVIEEHP